MRQALRDAYSAGDASRARRLLTPRRAPRRSGSLNEGFDETLTVKRLDLPSKLERQLSTTNSIENLMGSVSSRVV